MKLSVKDIQGQPAGEFELNIALVEADRGLQAVHDTVVAFRAAQRSGTACTKTVGEVAGTNKKPWKQKGTGRARAGSFRSPLWRGGGVVFGPKPRDYRKKISKSTRQLSVRKALTERLNAGDVLVIKNLVFDAPKTKTFRAFLAAHNIEGTVLVVSKNTDRNVFLSARNIPGVEMTTGSDVNTYQILRHDKLIFTESALEVLQGRLTRE